MTVAAIASDLKRGVDAIAFRESRANVQRRIAREETPATCGGCGTETDVTYPAHSPQCAGYASEVVEEKPAEKSGWYRDERGRRLNHKETASDGSKTLSQMTREQTLREDAQPMIMRCGVAGCDWSIASTAGEGPEVARSHRKDAHPWMNEKRRTAVERRTAIEDAERRAAALSGREPEAREADVGLLPATDSGVLPAVAVVRESRGPAGTELASRSESATAKNGRGRPKLWTPEKIIARLQKSARAGHVPSTKDLGRGGMPTQTACTREFGSFAKALDAAGLERSAKISGRSEAVGDQAVTGSASMTQQDPGEAEADGLADVSALPVRPGDTGRPDESSWSRRPRTREEVVEAIQRFAREHGRPPVRSDFEGHTAQYVSPGVADRLFGSWSDAVVAAGFPRPTAARRDAWTRESAIAALQQRAAAFGRTPTSEDLDGLPGVSAFRRLFGSWSGYVEAAGFARPGHGAPRRPTAEIAPREEASDEVAKPIPPSAAGEVSASQSAGPTEQPTPLRPAVPVAPDLDLEAVRQATLLAVNALFDLLATVERTVGAAA